MSLEPTTQPTSYFISNYGWTPARDLGNCSSMITPVWHDIFKGLDFFHSITRVSVGNGSTTSFWYDLWLPSENTPLSQQFTALFSHSNRPTASVAWVLDSPQLNLDLTPRLSYAAENELANLRAILATINLNMQVTDVRNNRWDGKPLTNRRAYMALWSAAPADPLATPLWKNYSPNKCRMFVWLAHKDRVFTHERRFKHSIATSDQCPLCDGRESIDHLLFQCQLLHPLWDELKSLHFGSHQSLLDIWNADRANKVRSTIIIALLWNIWKRRNTKVFRNDTLGVYHIARSAADDLMLWSHRCKNVQKQNLLRDWSSMLFHLAGRI